MESNKSKVDFSEELSLKFNLKTLIIVLLFVAGLYLLIPRLVGMEQVLKLIFKVNPFYLILAILVEFVSYCAAAWLLGIILLRLGHKIRFWERFKIGSIAAFSIHFFPLGSLGQGAVDYFFLRRRDVPSGSIFIMLILRIIFTYAAFLLLFLVGLILVPTVPSLPFSPKLVSGILFLMGAFIVIYLVYLYHHRTRFLRVWTKYFGKINRILLFLKRKPVSEQKQEDIFGDIYSGIGLFGNKKRTSAMALFAGVLYWLGDIFCLYFVFKGFGYVVPLGVLFFAYGVGTLAGLISMVPGGVVVTEGFLSLAFAALGVPISTAVTVILVFRFFSFWIWIPVGLFSFITLIKNEKKTQNRAKS